MTDELPSDIYRHWMKSTQDKDADQEVLVLRPAGSNFLQSRGMEGFDIQKNGNIVFYQLDPSDRPKKTLGYFTQESSDSIRVSFEDKNTKPLLIRILSLHGDVLRIKILRDF
ncbi:MAG: hypothetical protein L0H53_08675 [Candidatus Nitrosocosmicus sp.]|nr:hypothetical protein [Candidatus Nitrosocosmicus sp.]MDN5868462.1 hypothetical protein [Candidatus Nitrosocosmicus sp.]